MKAAVIRVEQVIAALKHFNDEGSKAGAFIIFPDYDVTELDEKSGNVNKKFDPVTKPKHYNSHPSGVQCIEIARHMSFNLGNAIKYIWRADEKNNALEDLEKAKWYLDDEIAKRKGEKRIT